MQRQQNLQYDKYLFFSDVFFYGIIECLTNLYVHIVVQKGGLHEMAQLIGRITEAYFLFSAL